MIQDLRVRVTEYSALNRCRLFRNLYLDSRRRLYSFVSFTRNPPLTFVAASLQKPPLGAYVRIVRVKVSS